MHLPLRLPLLLLALSLPVTTSYGRVYSLSPHLGDVGGGMRVNLTGRDFVDYGDVRCRFGTNAWTRATVDTATSMHCLTPANFSDQLLFPLASPSGRVDVPVEVTFNGVTWSSSDWCRAPPLPSAGPFEAVTLDVTLCQLFTYFDD